MFSSIYFSHCLCFSPSLSFSENSTVTSNSQHAHNSYGLYFQAKDGRGGFCFCSANCGLWCRPIHKLGKLSDIFYIRPLLHWPHSKGIEFMWVGRFHIQIGSFASWVPPGPAVSHPRMTPALGDTMLYTDAFLWWRNFWGTEKEGIASILGYILYQIFLHLQKHQQYLF